MSRLQRIAGAVLLGCMASLPAGTSSAQSVATSGAAPAPAHANYRIGAGDVLELRVLGEEQMSSPTIRVRADGFIQVPFVDEDIQAQCLTERELGEVIAAKLKKYLKYPEVHVAVKEFNSMPVAIIGAVNQPGRFQMQRRVSLLELLTYAGGVKSDSAGKFLHLIHLEADVVCDLPSSAGGTTAADVSPTESINLKRLQDGDLSVNRVLRPGDIVIVPTADLIFIAGEVLKPNAYPLREGLTFTQALALAGGPSGVAKTGSIRVVRQDASKGRVEIPIDLKAVQSGKAPDIVLMANDVIEVPSSGGKTFFRNFFGALGGSVGNLPVMAVP